MLPEPEDKTDVSVSPLFAQSKEAFYQNLPEMLKKHCGQWVAFHGDECMGFGRTQTELYHKCLRRGLKQDEFVVLFADKMALHDHDEVDIAWDP
jgi:hypothetical protein